MTNDETRNTTSFYCLVYISQMNIGNIGLKFLSAQCNATFKNKVGYL